jgi:hypothetical protein
MKDFFFDDFIEQIKEFQRQQVEERERMLAEVVTNYDFMVGSNELKTTLEQILPEGAKIIYSYYIDDPTKCYAIKKFDVMDLLFNDIKKGENYDT